MRLVQAQQAQALTGLSSDQLREWSRRGLILPDIRPRGPGSRAGYAWQTVLILRVAVVLNKSFRIELQALRSQLHALRARLDGTSFPALRGMALLLRASGEFDLEAIDSVAVRGDCVVITLDPHLNVLSTGFGILEHRPQLPLFPAVAV